jgi:hypothetical protein
VIFIKSKYIVSIIIVILIIMGLGLLVANNNTNDQKNNANNNNINNITDNATDSNVSLGTNINKNANTNAYIQKNRPSQSSEFTAAEAKKTVEKYVSFDTEVVVSKPTYKNKDLGWLVPARDKKTGEFAGSVYVYSNHGPFVHGPDYYKDYKKLVSKNTDKYQKSKPKPQQTNEPILISKKQAINIAKGFLEPYEGSGGVSNHAKLIKVGKKHYWVINKYDYELNIDAKTGNILIPKKDN